jgi:hypothetical protein
MGLAALPMIFDRQHLGDKGTARSNATKLCSATSRQGWALPYLVQERDLHASNAETHPTTGKQTPNYSNTSLASPPVMAKQTTDSYPSPFSPAWGLRF